MELLQYWRIIRRRWWLPVFLTLAALVASTVVALRGAGAYRTDMRLAISTLPTVEASNSPLYDPSYFANLTSEYLADDLSEIIRSEAFALDVSQELGYTIDPATISNVTRTKKTHRLIDVTITTPSREQGAEIAGAMERILNDPSRRGAYLKAMDAYRGQVSIVNQPITRRPPLLGLVAEIGLRTLVGLVLGLGLAFLVDYVDQTVRTRHEAEEVLGLPVLGEIPRARRGVLA
jgi:capsular polysaccharide biosynthesis protein